MYAPKFQSWLSTWDRFDAALAYRIDATCDDAIREIHEMAETAKKEFRQPEQKCPPDFAMSPLDISKLLERTPQQMDAYRRQLDALMRQAPYPAGQFGNAALGQSFVGGLFESIGMAGAYPAHRWP